MIVFGVCGGGTIYWSYGLGTIMVLITVGAPPIYRASDTIARLVAVVRSSCIMVLVTVGAPPICRASHPPSAATEKQSSSSTIFQEQKQGLTRVRIKRSSSIHNSTQLASWLRTAAIHNATESQPEHPTPFPRQELKPRTPSRPIQWGCFLMSRLIAP